jgi:hypothetical protein
MMKLSSLRKLIAKLDGLLLDDAEMDYLRKRLTILTTSTKHELDEYRMAELRGVALTTVAALAQNPQKHGVALKLAKKLANRVGVDGDDMADALGLDDDILDDADDASFLDDGDALRGVPPAGTRPRVRPGDARPSDVRNMDDGDALGGYRPGQDISATPGVRRMPDSGGDYAPRADVSPVGGRTPPKDGDGKFLDASPDAINPSSQFHLSQEQKRTARLLGLREDEVLGRMRQRYGARQQTADGEVLAAMPPKRFATSARLFDDLGRSVALKGHNPKSLEVFGYREQPEHFGKVAEAAREATEAHRHQVERVGAELNHLAGSASPPTNVAAPKPRAHKPLTVKLSDREDEIWCDRCQESHGRHFPNRGGE